jgi:hypothetical protein
LFNPKVDKHVIVTEDHAEATTGQDGGVGYWD